VLPVAARGPNEFDLRGCTTTRTAQTTRPSREEEEGDAYAWVLPLLHASVSKTASETVCRYARRAVFFGSRASTHHHHLASSSSTRVGARSTPEGKRRWIRKMAKRTAALTLIAMLVIAFFASVNGETTTASSCLTRQETIGVSITTTNSSTSDARYLGVLAHFGSEVGVTAGASLPLAVASGDKLACGSITEVSGEIVLVWRGTCSFLEKASNAQAAGASAVVVVTDGNELSPMTCEGDASIKIPAMMVSSADGDALATRAAAGDTVALAVLPTTGNVDLVASLALLTIATITILFGSMWARADQLITLYPKFENGSGGGPGEEEGLQITGMSALYFVVFSSAVLLLIFFTMHHWVFTIIRCVFCFAAVQGLQAFFFAVLETLAKGDRANPKASYVFAVVIVAVWFFNQNASWAWILQDVLGVSFLVNVLRLVRLPSLRVGTMLLCAAMAYDIFWVYLQPHLFSGESVMVKVATGGENHESLPMLFLFPRLDYDADSGGKEFSMLGYGDVILPGLLIVHNHLFDNSANQTIRARNAWLFPSLVMYVFGLLVTFAALHFEVGGQGGQPALCYLTPTVVGGTVLYARARGDFDRMWAGDAGEEEEGYIAGEGDRERLMPRYSSV